MVFLPAGGMPPPPDDDDSEWGGDPLTPPPAPRAPLGEDDDTPSEVGSTVTDDSAGASRTLIDGEDDPAGGADTSVESLDGWDVATPRKTAIAAAAAAAAAAAEVSSPITSGRIDELLRGTTADYETWESRADARSLTAVRGMSQRRLGATELNASLAADHLARHRHVLAPDEAFGAVFMIDSLLANRRQEELAAWRTVAAAQTPPLPPPDFDDILRAESMPPALAVERVFYWTRDWGEVQRLLRAKDEALAAAALDTLEAVPGALAWLEALGRYGVRTAVLAEGMSRSQVRAVVDAMGLAHVVPSMEVVSADDECDTAEQALLLAACRVDRPPCKMVVFTDAPAGVTAAHEVSAKAVALVSAYKAWELRAADCCVGDYDELKVMNVRRLFAEGGPGVGELEAQLEVQTKTGM